MVFILSGKEIKIITYLSHIFIVISLGAKVISVVKKN